MVGRGARIGSAQESARAGAAFEEAEILEIAQRACGGWAGNAVALGDFHFTGEAAGVRVFPFGDLPAEGFEDHAVLGLAEGHGVPLRREDASR